MALNLHQLFFLPKFEVLTTIKRFTLMLRNFMPHWLANTYRTFWGISCHNL